MASIPLPDQENPEQQIVSRKALLSEPGAPRTPFAEVNQQPALRADLWGGSDLKHRQSASNRRSWAPGHHLESSVPGKKQSCITSNLHCTPLRSKATKTPLLKQVLKREGSQAADAHTEASAQALDSMDALCVQSQPSSPVTSDDQLLPNISQSCPEMLSTDIPLPPITEDSPEKLSTSLERQLPSLSPLPDLPKTPATPDSLSQTPTSPDSQTPASPDLSMGCEEGTPLPSHLSCVSESDVDSSYYYYDDGVEGDFSLSETPEGVTRFSDEGISSESDTTQERKSPLQDVSKMTMAEMSQSGSLLAASGRLTESEQAASYILDMLLNTVEKNAKMTDFDTQGQTFLSEYARFVYSYDHQDNNEGSAAFVNQTCSLTDVTPYSEVEKSMSGCTLSDSQLGEGEGDGSRPSLSSDSDESLSRTTPVQRHLSFQDRDPSSFSTSEAANLDDSFAWVRSSQSYMDLREAPAQGREEREDSMEGDFLNLSFSDQKVEFISLPPKLKSASSSPSALSLEAETMTVPASPVIRICDRSTSTDTPDTHITTVRNMHSVALSPMAADVCHQGANTSLVHTADADTMTYMVVTREVALSPKPVHTSDVGSSPRQVLTNDVALSPKPTYTSDVALSPKPTLTSDIALSPMAVPTREVDTMTTVAVTSEVGMETESADCQDRSMLATADMDSKTTMTDGTGHRNTATTMTPFKIMVKEGRRLTADAVRKQHPRALANQLETLTVSNTRLESEVCSAHQETKRLQAALRETKQQASKAQKELDTIDTHKLQEWESTEKELKEQCWFLEKQRDEQHSRAVALEQELVTLRGESEAKTRQLTQQLTDLQDKCAQLEEQLAAEQTKQPEVGEETGDSDEKYRRQFERAQHMVLEREAELQEVRELFTDLQTTACKQEEVHAAYQVMHQKILDLARENQTLSTSLHTTSQLWQEETERWQTQTRALQEDRAGMMDKLSAVTSTMAVHTSNLAELENLYSVSSADLLATTGRVVELNNELFSARKVIQELVLSREAAVQQSQALQEELSALRESEAMLGAGLQHTQQQLAEHATMYERLQTTSQKMKKVYEDKLENMALGVENLQLLLDQREMDMDHLEKDLYHCRSVIVDQRQAMDTLQTELSRTQAIVETHRQEEEEIDFYKKSNAFLEAERQVYVDSIRDMEERLQAMGQDHTRQQQRASEALKNLREMEAHNDTLRSQLTQTENGFESCMQALNQAKDERDRMEREVTASANDLLQHMRLLLTQLKKKTGLQEVPETYPTEADPPPMQQQQQQDLPSSAHRCSSSRHAVKSRRHARKSFVSSILGAAEPETGTEAEPEDSDWETGSYLGKSMTRSVRKALLAKQAASEDRDQGSMSSSSVVKRDVREVRVTTADAPQDSCGGRRKLDFSSHVPSSRPLSVSWTESTCSPCDKPAQTSSSFTVPSLHHPPSSDPRHQHTSAGLAKVRALPRTQMHSQPSSAWACVGDGGDGREGVEGGDAVMVGCVASLKEVFTSISRLFSILDRATQLSLQDLHEENAVLRDRTKKLEEICECQRADLTSSRQESVEKDGTLSRLQQQFQEMTEQMMNLTDQKFQIKRLTDELKRVENELLHERKEKEAVSCELETVLHRMETSSGGASAEARCMRDIVALKKKNLQLVLQKEEQRNHYEDLGAKAARRMRVLDENWKKAEDELYRLDELVENVKQIAERSSSPSSDLHHILKLIQGETKSSPL